MPKKNKRLKRPTEFTYETFKWKINWFDKAGPNIDAFGTTCTDSKVINLYVDHLPKEVSQEVLLHELFHVLHENIEDTKSNEKQSAINEELHIRLLTPRTFTLFRENPALLDYIFGYHND